MNKCLKGFLSTVFAVVVAAPMAFAADPAQNMECLVVPTLNDWLEGEFTFRLAKNSDSSSYTLVYESTYTRPLSRSANKVMSTTPFVLETDLVCELEDANSAIVNCYGEKSNAYFGVRQIAPELITTHFGIGDEPSLELRYNRAGGWDAVVDPVETLELMAIVVDHPETTKIGTSEKTFLSAQVSELISLQSCTIK